MNAKKKRKKPTLVELVAQIISITKKDKIKKNQIFWEAQISRAEAVVYCILLAFDNRSLFSVIGLKKKLLKSPWQKEA